MSSPEVMKAPPVMPALSGAKAKERGLALGRELRGFLLRGNVVDLAIAVVMGVAFGAVVSALVEDLVTPLIAALGGQPDFSALTFTVNHSVFRYGDVLNKVIGFLTVGTVVFFLVRPLNRLAARSAPVPPPPPKTMTCPECLSQIPEGAHRCAHCTAVLG